MSNGSAAVVASIAPAVIAGGAELVKLLIMLALAEARRSKMTPEETKAALEIASAEFELNNPDNIPDVE